MPNTIITILLILISFLPNSSFTRNLNKNFSEQLLPEKKTEIEKEDFKIPSPKDYAEVAVGAKGAIFVDASSGKILYKKNDEIRLPMASTTKLMTALIAVEKIPDDKLLTVPTLNTRPFDSVVGFSKGDKVRLSVALHGLLIPSGSDAALTIARNVATTDEEFVALMNEKASVMELTNTQFSNPVGWDDSNNFSTPKDLVQLARLALSNKEIASIVAKRTYTLKTENGKSFYLSNTNKLLNGTTIKGLKTGTTWQAGECLITYFNDGEKKIIGVVLGSNDRFTETEQILEWTNHNFLW